MHHMIQRLVTNLDVDTGGSHRTQDIWEILYCPESKTPS